MDSVMASNNSQYVNENNAELKIQNNILLEELEKEKEKGQYLGIQVKELTRFNQELKHNACIIAHELKAPLSVVSNYIQVLNKNYRNNLDDKGKSILMIAMDHIDMIKRMMNSIKDYSEKLKCDTFEEVDLNKIVEFILSHFKPMLEDSEVTIYCNAMPIIQSNRIQMLQVFLNLISNSLKFRTKENPVININSEEKDNEWLISFQDNGIGIAKEHFEDVFILFKRLDEAAYLGEGIGLAICKGIIEKHQGKIWIESDQEKGSTFFFTIPKSQSLSS